MQVERKNISEIDGIRNKTIQDAHCRQITFDLHLGLGFENLTRWKRRLTNGECPTGPVMEPKTMEVGRKQTTLPEGTLLNRQQYSGQIDLWRRQPHWRCLTPRDCHSSQHRGLHLHSHRCPWSCADCTGRSQWLLSSQQKYRVPLRGLHW